MKKTLAAISALIVFQVSVFTSALSQERRVVPRPPKNGRRMALVIGNGAYAIGPLKNPIGDARDVRTALGAKGFDVNDSCCDNLDAEALERTIGSWIRRLEPGDIAFFFYAGHGARAENEDYLIPVDWSSDYSQADLPYKAYDVGRIQDKVIERGTSVSVIILDACRNNPFSFGRGLDKGMSNIPASLGSMILFSASPGMTVDDKPTSNHSLFSQILVQELSAPIMTLRKMAEEVKQRVFELSKGSQIPWSSDNIIYDLNLVNGADEHVQVSPDVPGDSSTVSRTASPPTTNQETVPSADEVTVKPPGSRQGVITCSGLGSRANLYLFSDATSMRTVASVACGSAVQIQEGDAGSKWWRVTSPLGQSGWIQSMYIVEQTDAWAASGQMYIDCSLLPGRKALSLFSSPTEATGYSVGCGSTVSIISKDDNRFRVRTSDGNEGWIQAQYLKVIK